MFPALSVSLAVVFGAPYVGQIRGAIQSAFPDHYRLIVGAIVAVAAAGAVASAVAGLRRPRRRQGAGESASLPLPARYALVIAAVAVSGVYAGALFRWNPDVALVESFHFVEYGLVAFLYYRAWRHRPDVSGVVLALGAGIAVGVADEWMQWFVPGRVGEMHDIWLNAAAVCCGVMAAAAVHPPASLRLPDRRRSRFEMGAAMAGLLVAVAAFVSRVHVGYEISDPQAGTFRSQYNARELSAAAADRTARWKASPPPDRGLTREDHYLIEGQWHAQRRNAAVGIQDWSTAWSENLILERFYAPVLDYGHRWLDEERSTIERSAAGTKGESYVSDAAPYPMYVIRRSMLWGATALVAAMIVWLSGRGRKAAQAVQV